MGSDWWQERLAARWESRRAVQVGDPRVVLGRLSSHVSREFAAPRARVWGAALLPDEEEGEVHVLAGSPTTGPGAKHVHVGAPQPPWGLAAVVYCEVLVHDEELGTITTRSQTTASESTTTWQLTTTPDGSTRVDATVEDLRPRVRGTDTTALQACLDAGAAHKLARLAARLDGAPGSTS